MPIRPVASEFHANTRIRKSTQKNALFIFKMTEVDEDGLLGKMVVIERIAQAFMI